jgi:hypothetical protein
LDSFGVPKIKMSNEWPLGQVRTDEETKRGRYIKESRNRVQIKKDYIYGFVIK